MSQNFGGALKMHSGKNNPFYIIDFCIDLPVVCLYDKKTGIILFLGDTFE